MDVSNERARRAGLELTDPEVTLSDTRAWMRGREHTLPLSPEREAELIRMSAQDSRQGAVQSQRSATEKS